MNFKVHELMDVISLRESRNKRVTMFVDTPDQVLCHPNVKSAAWTACEHVYVELPHDLEHA